MQEFSWERTQPSKLSERVRIPSPAPNDMYKIYFTNEYNEARSYNEDSLSEALKIAEGLRRNQRNSFVVMTSENPNCVGKQGVDSVVEGKLPDGNDYEWKKRRK
jgi:hypothetical protein